jgi:hypothetical protein
MAQADPIQTILNIMRTAAPAPAPDGPQPSVVVTGNGNLVATGDVHVHVLPGSLGALNGVLLGVEGRVS